MCIRDRLGTNRFHVRAEDERFTAASSRCRRNLKYENPTSSFGRLRENFSPESVPHVHNGYYSLFNQSDHKGVYATTTTTQQERHKFAYLTVKNNRFARFARAFFIFGHSADVLVLSTTWNNLFCSCEDDVSARWQMFNFVFLSLKRWFQFNSWIGRTHLQPWWLWIIQKWLRKREVTFSDDVLAAVDVVFA